ncbi:MAG: DUF6089 family protein [Saprospiraceae bacterium]|nr:DUF6089 family protein [Saprospiraceae bacterium]
MKYVQISIIVLLFHTLGIAQYSSISFGLGTSNYLGDLVPPQQFFLETRVAANLGYQYNFSPRLVAKTQVILGQLAGNDQNSAIGTGRYERNLSFKSSLFEWNLIGQFNIIPYKPEKGKTAFTVYPFAGIALFHFNPKTEYQGEWIALQPLGTEGQGSSTYPDRRVYKRTQLAIPFGAGLTVGLNKKLNLNLEFGLRKTFTDYIDDVSLDYVDPEILKRENGLLAAALSNRSYDVDGNQIDKTNVPRGSAGKDWYTILQVNLSYNLFTGRPFR